MDVLLEFLKNNWLSILIYLAIITYNSIITVIEKSIDKNTDILPERLMEKIKLKHSLFLQRDEQHSAKILQVDNYYRSISGNIIEKLFSTWMDVIANTNKITNLSAEKMNKMIKELMMYGSERTVHLGSVFMQ